jgi:hypothetical protein
MVKLKDYKKNFRPHEVPAALAKLVELDAKIDGYFSAGFELGPDDKTGIKTWSTDAGFVDSLFPIGQANGSGSTYALWLDKAGKASDLDAAPVVVFGDEGGVHVIAENIKTLLRILTFDSEPMIDTDGVTFYKDPDDHEPSAGAEDYVKWLAKQLEQKPVKNAKEIEGLVKAAQKKFAKPFAAWMKQYCEV